LQTGLFLLTGQEFPLNDLPFSCVAQHRASISDIMTCLPLRHSLRSQYPARGSTAREFSQKRGPDDHAADFGLNDTGIFCH
jgi:hypothetical protein